MTDLTNIGQKIKDATHALATANSELKWEMAASAADVAGIVDPTPASDLIGAGLALRKGDFWGAGLSVASMIPYAGDALAKPAKAVRATKKIVELQQKIAKITAKLNDLRKVEKEAKAAEEAAKKAKIAKEAAEAAKAKKALEDQQAAAKAKDQDCEDCGAAGKGKAAKASKLPETKVPCFHPFDKPKFKRLDKAGQQEYMKSMNKQLTRQQEAINSVTADEFKTAREAFLQFKRNPLADASQDALRKQMKTQVAYSIQQSLISRKIGYREARTIANARADELMSKLVALHEPDMVAGGWMKPAPTSIGRSDINASIGGSWNQSGRLAAMDEAAEKAISSGRGAEKMNVTLELCRGKGLK